MDCIDATVSITEKQMKALVASTIRIEEIIGIPKFGVREVEKDIEPFRRFS
jgi:hypothetical protein